MAETYQFKDDYQVDKKKEKSTIGCLYESHFKYKDKERLNMKGWRKLHYDKTNQKKARIATLISGKANFRTRKSY